MSTRYGDNEDEQYHCKEWSMKKKTPYELWYMRYYIHYAADRCIEPFLTVPVCGPWLMAARRAQFLSVTRLASQLGVSRAAYRKLESSEEAGTISLANLKRSAQAMDCELVYAIRPKSRKLFSHSVWEILMAAARLPTVHHACMKMYDSRFRRLQGWERKLPPRAEEYLPVLKANRDLNGRAI
jgi:transcriptional regulator with XRE-family HTH domain